MNTSNLTQESITFEQFKQFLLNECNPYNQIYDITGATETEAVLHEFKHFPTIEIGINTYKDFLQIYLNIGSGFSSEFYTDLHQYHTQLFEILNDYISRTYMENTDNDPLSYSYSYTAPGSEPTEIGDEGFDLIVRIESIY